MPLPLAFLINPLAEVFRLADKTSLPPVAEIERYHQSGKNFGTVFFVPELTDEFRFDFSRGTADWDQINYFFTFFLLGSHDFFFGETRDAYRNWCYNKKGNKHRAAEKIIEFAKQEGLDKQQLRRVVDLFDRFSERFDLPHYFNDVSF